MAGRPNPDPVAAFWAQVDMSGGPDACWPWRACKGENVYGKVKWTEGGQRRQDRAHRRAFEISNGWLPKGKGRGCGLVRHACDFKPCCNPAHLLSGTQVDNAHDAIERGLYVPPPVFHGEAHPRARLTAEIVRSAREAHLAGVSASALARQHGVGGSTMDHALHGRTWGHVQ